jgi:hypothetical protein
MENEPPELQDKRGFMKRDPLWQVNASAKLHIGKME